MEPVNPYAAPLAPLEAAPLAAAEQPLTVLGALGGGTSLFLRRFPTLAAISLSVFAPLEAFVSYLEYFVLDPDDVFGVVRLSLLADGLIGIIAIGGVISVAAADVRGQDCGWLSGLGNGLKGWFRLFSSRFVSSLAVIVAAVFFVLPAIYLGVRFSLSDAAAVIERRAGTNAISRSMELTRGRFLTFFGLGLMTIMPNLIVGGLIYLPLTFWPQFDHWLSSAALTCVVDLLNVWMAVVFVLAYVQCVATERREDEPAQTPLPADAGQIHS